MDKSKYFQIGYNDASAGRKYNQDQFREELGTKWLSDTGLDVRSDYMEGYDSYFIHNKKLNNFVVVAEPIGVKSEFHELKSLHNLIYD